jgi:putative spermidine/putrescine transport system ATP-binding protein
VRDNVAFPLTAAGARRRDARRAAEAFLELTGAVDLARRRVGTLSGGQEQRVALARALAARPDVLLLDEPFSALDSQARAQMHALVAALRATVEPTLVLVTHDRAEAAALADTVAVLLDGHIVQQAPPAELHARPATLAVHRLLGGRNVVPGTVVDGAHVSGLGRFDLPSGVSAVPDGPATLVVRQEAVRVVDAADGTADVVGTVAAVRSLGASEAVRVDVRGIELEAHVAAGPSPRPAGTRVGLVLPLTHRHVVRCGVSPSDAAGRPPEGAAARPGPADRSGR